MKELNDEDLLEFLMNSEFSEEYKPEEFRFLLHKFRYFYRVLYGRQSNIIGQKQLEIENLNRDINFLKKNIENISIEKARLQDEVDLQPSIKKLTWLERIKGKVSLKNNNDK